MTLKKKEEKAWKHLRKCDQEADDKKKKKEALVFTLSYIYLLVLKHDVIKCQ